MCCKYDSRGLSDDDGNEFEEDHRALRARLLSTLFTHALVANATTIARAGKEIDSCHIYTSSSHSIVQRA